MTKAMMKVSKMRGMLYIVYLAMGVLLTAMDIFGKKEVQG